MDILTTILKILFYWGVVFFIMKVGYDKITKEE